MQHFAAGAFNPADVGVAGNILFPQLSLLSWGMQSWAACVPMLFTTQPASTAVLLRMLSSCKLPH